MKTKADKERKAFEQAQAEKKRADLERQNLEIQRIKAEKDARIAALEQETAEQC
jgi:hypothetical protein